MRSRSNRLHHELGTTIIYVTHDQVEAPTISTKIAISRASWSRWSAHGDLPEPISLRVATLPATNVQLCGGKAVREPQARCAKAPWEVFSPELFTEDMPESGEFDCVIEIRPEKVAGAPGPGGQRSRACIFHAVRRIGHHGVGNAGQSALPVQGDRHSSSTTWIRRFTFAINWTR